MAIRRKRNQWEHDGDRSTRVSSTYGLTSLVQQAWEMGDVELCLIHGHGRNRGKSPGFVNTNTGFLGLEIRRRLRNDPTLRKWIHHTTVRSDHPGATTVKLKRNPWPKRAELEPLPERDFC